DVGRGWPAADHFADMRTMVAAGGRRTSFKALCMINLTTLVRDDFCWIGEGLAGARKPTCPSRGRRWRSGRRRPAGGDPKVRGRSRPWAEPQGDRAERPPECASRLCIRKLDDQPAAGSEVGLFPQFLAGHQ